MMITEEGIRFTYEQSGKVYDSSFTEIQLADDDRNRDSESKRAHDADSENKPRKKTVRQKIKNVYHDVANLWRTDKKKCALYAAGACALVIVGIGAIKYAKKKKLGVKIASALGKFRRMRK